METHFLGEKAKAYRNMAIVRLKDVKHILEVHPTKWVKVQLPYLTIGMVIFNYLYY